MKHQKSSVSANRRPHFIPLDATQLLFGDDAVHAYRNGLKGIWRSPSRGQGVPLSFSRDMTQVFLDVCGAPVRGDAFWSAFEDAAQTQLASLPLQYDRRKVARLATKALRATMGVAAPRGVLVDGYEIRLCPHEGYVSHAKVSEPDVF